MFIYQRPTVSRVWHAPVAICQYAFRNFSGNSSNPGLSSDRKCTVRENAAAFAACISGNANITHYKLVILENGSPLETVTIESDGNFPDCELDQNQGPGQECQVGDTFVLCHDISTVFSPTPNVSPYTLELLDGNDNPIATSEPCPASLT